MEARVGIEPTHKGFADLSLTTWVPRPVFRQKLPQRLLACSKGGSDWPLERETGVEPATSTLARSRSTTELLPPLLEQYIECRPHGQRTPRRGSIDGTQQAELQIQKFLTAIVPGLDLRAFFLRDAGRTLWQVALQHVLCIWISFRMLLRMTLVAAQGGVRILAYTVFREHTTSLLSQAAANRQQPPAIAIQYRPLGRLTQR